MYNVHRPKLNVVVWKLSCMKLENKKLFVQKLCVVKSATREYSVADETFIAAVEFKCVLI